MIIAFQQSHNIVTLNQRKNSGRCFWLVINRIKSYANKIMSQWTDDVGTIVFTACWLKKLHKMCYWWQAQKYLDYVITFPLVIFTPNGIKIQEHQNRPTLLNTEVLLYIICKHSKILCLYSQSIVISQHKLLPSI